MARDHGLEEILREDLEALSGLSENQMKNKLCRLHQRIALDEILY